MSSEHRRAADAQALRVAASFFVVLIHTAAQLTGGDRSSAGYLIPTFFNALGRFSVPVFVMLSGRFLLAHTPDIRYSLRRAARLFCMLVFWGSVYWLDGALTRGFGGMTLRTAVWEILTQPVHLWYFYAAIGLSLFLPMLAVFAQNASRRQMEYALAVTLLFGSVVELLLRTSHFALLREIVDKMKLDTTLGFVWCSLFGYYVYQYEHRADRASLAVRRLIGWGAVLLGTAATFLGTVLLSRRSAAAGALPLSFFAPNVLLAAAGAFLLAKWFAGHIPPRSARLVGLAAPCTAGIYGIHMLWLRHLPFGPAGYLSALLVPAAAAAIFVLSALAVFLLRRIPGLRRLL